jgi:hypothetical protein
MGMQRFWRGNRRSAPGEVGLQEIRAGAPETGVWRPKRKPTRAPSRPEAWGGRESC